MARSSKVRECESSKVEAGASAGKTWTHPETGKVYDVVQGEKLEHVCPLCCFKDDDACPKGGLPGNSACQDFGQEAYFVEAAAVRTEAKEAGAVPCGMTGEIRTVLLGMIKPSPYQMRKVSGTEELDKGLEELKLSILANGLANPLTVRPVAEGWELIAGHRRFEACKLAGLESVPCFVRDVDDRRAEELLVVENLQRKDLTPIEEARSVAAMAARGRSNEEIAAATGKSVRWVYRRAKLLDLSEAWTKAGEGFGLSARFLEELARLPIDLQGKIWERYAAGLREAQGAGIGERWIADNFARGGDVDGLLDVVRKELRLVADAPWAGLRDWCASCMSRTDFDGMSDEAGEPGCLDGACWARNVERWMAEVREEEKGKIREASGELAGLFKDGPDKASGYTERVLITDGDDKGKVMFARDEAAAAKAEKPGKEKGLTKAQSARAAYVLAVREMVAQMNTAVAVVALHDGTAPVPLTTVVGLALTFGIAAHTYCPAGAPSSACQVRLDKMMILTESETDAADHLWSCVRGEIVARLGRMDARDPDDEVYLAESLEERLGLCRALIEEAQARLMKTVGKSSKVREF